MFRFLPFNFHENNNIEICNIMWWCIEIATNSRQIEKNRTFKFAATRKKNQEKKSKEKQHQDCIYVCVALWQNTGKINNQNKQCALEKRLNHYFICAHKAMEKQKTITKTIQK